MAMVVMAIAILVIWSGTTQCLGQDASTPQAENDDSKTPADENTEDGPCVTGSGGDGPCVQENKPPQKGADSPFDKKNSSDESKPERRLWAHSFLWAKAPEFVVEKWLTDEPDRRGKYVLIEFWATWCGPCRRSISLLNGFHKKYGEELVVIGICEEDEENTRKLTEKYPKVPEIEFHLAIDTKKRMKEKLGVWGIPHVILLEPDGYVIWEGFPLQKGYELTDEIIERVLAVGRRLRAK
jgi:thiol-disulfide isomerase/thioredoxin